MTGLPNANEEAKGRPTRTRPKPVKRRLWAADVCQIDGCEIPPIARDLCSKHYQQARIDGTLPPKIRVALAGVACEVEACESKAVARHRCQRHALMARRYGLTTAQMVTLPTACEACGSTHRLHVDHNHGTGVYRGVLCSDCNTALGLLGDDVQRVISLLEYARSH